MADNLEEALAICVQPGRFYGGRSYPKDIKYETTCCSPGDWVRMRMSTSREGVPTVVGVKKTEPALTTIVHGGCVYLDVTVLFYQTGTFSEDLDDWIYVPPLADVEEFEYEVTYALLVTWMDNADRNFCAEKPGNDALARWKLAMHKSGESIADGLPTSRMGYSFLSRKKTKSLTGLVVGQDTNDKRRFYVWCPGCPLHYDGIVTEDPKCALKIGKFIRFLIDDHEYNDVFVRRESRHFWILSYDGVTTPPCQVFVQNCRGEDGKIKSIIKMSSTDFVKRSEGMRRVSDGTITGSIFHHNKLDISDDKGKLSVVPEGNICNMILIRQKPTEPWNTQWRVHEVVTHKRPPPSSAKKENGIPSLMDGMSKLNVEVKDRPAHVSRSKSVEVEEMRSIAPLSPPHSSSSNHATPTTPAAAAAHQVQQTPPTTPSVVAAAPAAGPFDDLDEDEHMAFVEAYSPRNEAVYLWIIDEPQQAVIWGCKGKRKPTVGTFLRGYFKQQADGRLYINMEDYEICSPPSNIQVFDRSGHALVRTDVIWEKSRRGDYVWSSKYLGVIEDTQRHMPRNVLNREKYVVHIGKRKLDHEFVWTIEMDVSKEAGANSGVGQRLTSTPSRRGQNGVTMRSPSSRSTGNEVTSPRRERPVSMASPPTQSISTSSASSSTAPPALHSAPLPPLPPPFSPSLLPSTPSHLPSTPSHLPSSPPVLPSPGFESRKTSLEEPDSPRAASRDEMMMRMMEQEDESRYEVNDEVWNEDTRLAREAREMDPCIKLVETFANGFSGLFCDDHIMDLFGTFMEPARFDRLMQLSSKHQGGVL